MSDESGAEEEDDRPCDSGPFCQHWGTPGECEECAAPCASCSHALVEHGDNGAGPCSEDDCACAAFVSSDA
jgi:hypothetical protein